MTLRDELEYIIFTLFAIAMCIAGIFAIRSHSQVPQQVSVQIPFPKTLLTPVPTVTPFPVQSTFEAKPFTPTVTFSSQVSSDGTEKMTMKQLVEQNDAVYSFTLTDATHPQGTLVFSQTVATTSAFVIPFNVFSPNDQYYFLEKDDGSIKHYLAFQTSGQSFGNSTDEDVSDIFQSHESDYTLIEVTGWASDNLLFINAKNNKTGVPESFWFDVTTQGITPLATYFP